VLPVRHIGVGGLSENDFICAAKVEQLMKM
jgi:hypothetical protein